MSTRLDGLAEFNILAPDKGCIAACVTAMQYTYKDPLSLENVEAGSRLEAMYFDDMFGIEFTSSDGRVHHAQKDLSETILIFQAFIDGRYPSVSGGEWTDITDLRFNDKATRSKLDIWLFGFFVVLCAALIIGSMIYVNTL